jgi:hypothetical protein
MGRHKTAKFRVGTGFLAHEQGTDAADAHVAEKSTEMAAAIRPLRLTTRVLSLTIE